ncbi:hypothetical protein, partial [Thermus sp.]|uniref:hypothetical protein n=1 Tax=Thermus sp. TaxID=275 RepID=UPI00307F210B
ASSWRWGGMAPSSPPPKVLRALPWALLFPPALAQGGLDLRSQVPRAEWGAQRSQEEAPRDAREDILSLLQKAVTFL